MLAIICLYRNSIILLWLFSYGLVQICLSVQTEFYHFLMLISVGMLLESPFIAAAR